MIRRGDFRFGIVRESHGPVHVRLTGAEPDVADEHVFEFDGLRPTAHGERVRTAGWERADARRPTARGVGRGGFAHGLTVERNLHDVARRGPTPHRGRDLALQHHVVGEERMDERQRPRLDGPPTLGLRRTHLRRFGFCPDCGPGESDEGREEEQERTTGAERLNHRGTEARRRGTRRPQTGDWKQSIGSRRGGLNRVCGGAKDEFA